MNVKSNKEKATHTSATYAYEKNDNRCWLKAGDIEVLVAHRDASPEKLGKLAQGHLDRMLENTRKERGGTK
jgi:hypothetical protein